MHISRRQRGNSQGKSCARCGFPLSGLPGRPRCPAGTDLSPSGEGVIRQEAAGQELGARRCEPRQEREPDMIHDHGRPPDGPSYWTEQCLVTRPDDPPKRPPWPPGVVVRRYPVSAFVVLVFALTGLLAVLPIPPGVYGPLENIVGAAVPAFIVTGVVAGRAGVLDLARRSLRWRVPLRWYALALLALPAAVLIIAVPLYGLDPVRALVQNWPALFTSYLPTLAFMIVLNNVAEETGWTGFLFSRLQQRHRPVYAALLSAIPFWCWHLLSFTHDEGSWLGGLALAGFLLLPLVATRFVTGWLYNASGASVLIAGLFHATHNATVNPTGFAVAVLHLPQGEIIYVLAALVTLAAVAITIATHGRLGARSRLGSTIGTPADSRLRRNSMRPGSLSAVSAAAASVEGGEGRVD